MKSINRKEKETPVPIRIIPPPTPTGDWVRELSSDSERCKKDQNDLPCRLPTLQRSHIQSIVLFSHSSND